MDGRPTVMVEVAPYLGPRHMQSPGVAAAMGGGAPPPRESASGPLGSVQTMASPGEYGFVGSLTINSLRTEVALLKAEVARLRNEFPVGAAASAPPPAAVLQPAGASAAAPPVASMPAEVTLFLAKLTAYMQAMQLHKEDAERTRWRNSSGAGRGGHGGSRMGHSGGDFTVYAGSGGGGGGSGSGGAGSSTSAVEPAAPVCTWKVLIPALHALARQEGLLTTRTPISLFRGLHPEEEDDIKPSRLCALLQETGPGTDSDGEEALREQAARREKEQRNRILADRFKKHRAFCSDTAVVIRALGLAGSLTRLIAGHASWQYKSEAPSARPTRSFTSLPQIADNRYAKDYTAVHSEGAAGHGYRTSSTIMVTFEQGDGLLVGVNMNHERLFPGAHLTHIRDHEFVFIGPHINLDAVRVMRWNSEGQMGGNRYGH